MSSMRLLLLFCTADAQRGWRNGNWISGFRAPEDVKAQWAARPPMFGPAPLANRRPVTDAPGKLAKPRTPAPLGEPLWPFPAQRYDADVVTGLALNYREFSHRAFVGTLRRAGYTGDVTLVTEPRSRRASRGRRLVELLLGRRDPGVARRPRRRRARRKPRVPRRAGPRSLRTRIELANRRPSAPWPDRQWPSLSRAWRGRCTTNAAARLPILRSSRSRG